MEKIQKKTQKKTQKIIKNVKCMKKIKILI